MTTSKGSGFVYVNGRFMPQEEASISVFDSGFLSGDAIFEGLRIHEGRALRLEEHLDMLWESAHALMMGLTLTRDEVREAVVETARRNGFKEDGYLRIQITRGRMSKPFMNPSLAEGESSMVIFPDPGPPSRGGEGARIITSSIRRVPPDSLDQKIHSCNKLNSLLAKLQANLVGADEALMLDESGFVAECSTTNIFLVKDGQVLTPHPKSCKLGVTRQAIMDGARGLGYEVVEKDISLYEAYNCDECFCCGTHGGITPVIEIDGRRVGDGGRGPVTENIVEFYSDLSGREGFPIYQ
jgi:branched-chain amino acid aminotransferase